MIKILDCTLRDGGYINDWEFGSKNISKIMNNLNASNIDIIEVGFLEDSTIKKSTKENTFFNSIDDIKNILPKVKTCNQYVAMTRFGYLDLDTLAPFDGEAIDGIRITFHIKDVTEAMAYCDEIKNKGYKIYIQPVGTTMYTDQEILSLIEKVNKIEPYAFYVVDTLGVMSKEDVLRIFYIIDHNLDSRIVRGYHSHNNLQLSFSNAQVLAEMKLMNDIIVDSSVDGMGRGAGNLHTELIGEFINRNFGHKYLLEHIMEIIDEYSIGARDNFVWGYSIPYYLAASKNCHPSYATYLINKKTLPIHSIASVLEMISKEQRELFNKELIQELYFQYQSNYIDDTNTYKTIKEMLRDNILLVAPGNSVHEYLSEINKYIRATNASVISINHCSDEIKSDYAFFSNNYRYKQFAESTENFSRDKVILTSNIQRKSNELIVNYASLLNEIENVKDNATLMIFRLLEKIGYSKIQIAGFDGYDIDGKSYISNEMNTNFEQEVYKGLNEGIRKYINIKGEHLDIKFITPSKYNDK